MEIEFTKMEGLGNDFILIDDRAGKTGSYRPYPELAQTLCSRHFNIGADGIILILNAKDHDIKFRIYNSDGSEAEMCGNGMRCFAKLLFEKKIISKKKFRVDTKAGTVIPEIITDDEGRVLFVRVDMGEPILLCRDIPFDSPNEKALDEPLTAGDREYRVTTVSMGNPHAVIFVDTYETLDLEAEGRAIETHARFPQKTNVEFIQVLNRNELNMKVWERGAGITLACGTGACAVLVAAHLTGRTEEKALIHLPGGDLEIHWDKTTNHVFKTGQANLVFEGRVKI
ncbi:MAG: diaminopimelate epimerase [Desulfobacterales bacterium RIFOXYA12_FULL_46_15]|nr:MAG: diaminopimelate epimerase [Desulfobacterales bacterium RIFOXYA12_FULL_46_15]